MLRNQKILSTVLVLRLRSVLDLNFYMGQEIHHSRPHAVAVFTPGTKDKVPDLVQRVPVAMSGGEKPIKDVIISP
jgi:hypothetical protein